MDSVQMFLGANKDYIGVNNASSRSIDRRQDGALTILGQ